MAATNVWYIDKFGMVCSNLLSDTWFLMVYSMPGPFLATFQ